MTKMTCSASLKCIPGSHYKVALVAALIRGLSAKDADLQLMFSKKTAAEPLRKLLRSCLANAENNHGMNSDSLVVSTVNVGKAMVLKRFMPRGRGKMSKIEKRYSRVSITLTSVDQKSGIGTDIVSRSDNKSKGK